MPRDRLDATYRKLARVLRPAPWEVRSPFPRGALHAYSGPLDSGARDAQGRCAGNEAVRIRRLASVTGLALAGVLVACGAGQEATGPVVLTVSDVHDEGHPTCDFAYHCAVEVVFLTSNLSTGKRVAGEVAITGIGDFPATATSSTLGRGQFTWTIPAEPGSYEIRVCPNVPSPAESRCRSLRVSIGDTPP